MARGRKTQRALPLEKFRYQERAGEKWIVFHDHIEQQMGNDLYPIRGLANKIPEISARLAGVLALVDDVAASEIGLNDLSRGVALARTLSRGGTWPASSRTDQRRPRFAPKSYWSG